MNTRKTEGEKAVPAGISLPRDLIDQGRAYAKSGGYGGLSGLARHLLTTYLGEAAQAAENASQRVKTKAKAKVKSGTKKVRNGRY